MAEPLCGTAKELPSFVPLDAHACQAIAKAAGIDVCKAVSLSLEFEGPAEVFITARYFVDAVAVGRILGALRATPVEKAL